jgi:hypothetical protein
MKYFDESENKLERIGKVIADIFVTVLVVGFAAIYTYSMIVR